MQRKFLRSKIHRATVTQADPDYVGSITVDEALLEAAEMAPYEWVQVVDINNGARLETYIIRAPAGSGTICLNGAAARLVQLGDPVIIMAYAFFAGESWRELVPRIVLVDEANRVVEVRRPEGLDVWLLADGAPRARKG